MLVGRTWDFRLEDLSKTCSETEHQVYITVPLKREANERVTSAENVEIHPGMV